MRYKPVVMTFLTFALLAAACSREIPGRGTATPSDCDFTVHTTGNLKGSDPVPVEEGQVLAIRVDGQSRGFGSPNERARFSLVDAALGVTNARLVTDNNGNSSTVGGFPPLSAEPGALYQHYRADWAQLVVIEVPTGASYKYYSSAGTDTGSIGTCTRPLSNGTTFPTRNDIPPQANLTYPGAIHFIDGFFTRGRKETYLDGTIDVVHTNLREGNGLPKDTTARQVHQWYETELTKAGWTKQPDNNNDFATATYEHTDTDNNLRYEAILHVAKFGDKLTHMDDTASEYSLHTWIYDNE